MPGQSRWWKGRFKYEFNNGKEVLLGFQNPHQTAFKALILKDDWKNFSLPPEKLYTTGQTVRVQGLIEWYQGDPVIYVHGPDQIWVEGGGSNAGSQAPAPTSYSILLQNLTQPGLTPLGK